MSLGDRMNQIKKYQKNNVKTNQVDSGDHELKKLCLLVVIIVAILGLIYLVSVLVKGTDYSSIFDQSLDVSEMQYDEVIIGNMLKQPEDQYYVLILDKEDPYKEIFDKYIDTYRDLEYETKIYTVDLNNIFNQSAKAEEESIDELKFKGTTLLKIVDHKVDEVIVDSLEIGSTILKMTKEIEDKEEA